MNFNEMTNSALTEHYNSLPGVTPIKRWGGKKTDLIAKIEEATPIEEDSGDVEGDVGKPRTIREASIDWLTRIAFYEDPTVKSGEENSVPPTHENARSVGYSYLTCLTGIKDEFPNADTSVACLRWYAVKIRVEEKGYEGHSLPQRRPRK